MKRTIIGFIITCALGCLCVAPLAADAQPPGQIRRVGILTAATAPTIEPLQELLRQGLRERGYMEASISSWSPAPSRGTMSGSRPSPPRWSRAPSTSW